MKQINIYIWKKCKNALEMVDSYEMLFIPSIKQLKLRIHAGSRIRCYNIEYNSILYTSIGW